MLRLDYTPEDCLQFQEAIEQVVVPAAARVYERYRLRLGVAALRPWDLDQDLYPILFPPFPALPDTEGLKAIAQRIFGKVDPQLQAYFKILRSEELLDLDNRKGKAPGAYCIFFPVTRRPFLFMNAAGLSDDIRTLLHESGHAFHNFERSRLPYSQQRNPGLEFSEVASMAMELLASPYLAEKKGGPYPDAEVRRFRTAHLEHILLFWPYMAIVDAFQHVVYRNPDRAADPNYCDALWCELRQRYIPAMDWSGLEDDAMTGWHRKAHIFRYPFYYVEYGLAQLGAVQVWRNSLSDPAGALARYRYALSLGGTQTLPELYAAAGANFAFDAGALSEAVDLIEQTIENLDQEG
jgi:oligoendopeptidase F